MKLSQIPNLRLASQQIINSKLKSPEEVVSYLGAVQSQDYSGAKWALGLRIPNSTDAQIDKAFNEGKLLRTHILRPTWHFVSPENIRWMLELSKPQVNRMMKYYEKQLELDEDLYKKTWSIFETALKGRNFLTREELGIELKKKGISAKGQRLAHIIFYSELDGLICSGPRKGKQFTYALIDDVAPKAKIFPRDESLSKLAKIFFETRGPATIKDFSKWSNLTQIDAKKGLDEIKSKLQSETIEGRLYWFSSTKIPANYKLPTTLLLPNYDEFISSYSDHSIIITEETRSNLEKIGNAVFWNHMVLNGNIVGSWRRIFKTKIVEIELAPLIKLSKEESDAFKKQAENFGEFYKQKVILK